MRMTEVANATRPFASLLRRVALILLAVLLLARLGPFCEVSAQAAPIASPMAGCEGKGSSAPQKKFVDAACATPCVAVPGEAIARVGLRPMPAASPWPASYVKMDDLPVAPAIPPPRTV